MRVTITNQTKTNSIDEDRLASAAKSVLAESNFCNGFVSVALVDDATIHELNHRFLNHDWPTDVLSFVLQEDGDTLEGEVVASVETAAATAPDYGWSAAEELLLYVVHGVLHLVGYRDNTRSAAEEMHAREASHLQRLGISEVPRRSLAGDSTKATLSARPSGGTKTK